MDLVHRMKSMQMEASTMITVFPISMTISQQWARAIEDGVDLFGYTVWSAMDIVSAGTGEMKKRYGLIYVDRHDDGSGDFKRIPKDSYYWYAKCIQENGKILPHKGLWR